LQNVQNKLGYVVHLAQRTVENRNAVQVLSKWQVERNMDRDRQDVLQFAQPALLKPGILTGPPFNDLRPNLLALQARHRLDGCFWATRSNRGLRLTNTCAMSAMSPASTIGALPKTGRFAFTACRGTPRMIWIPTPSPSPWM